MSNCYSFTITRNTTFSRVITWEDESGDPVDLTGYTAEMDLVRSGTTLLNLSTTNGRIALGGVAGTITLTISADDTADLTDGNAEYDLLMTSSGGVVTQLLEGQVVIEDTVTH